MTFPAPADFTSPDPTSAWWRFSAADGASYRYTSNAATLLATARQRLGLPATPRDLKWDGQFLQALNDRARVLSARGAPFFDFMVRFSPLPTDRVTRATVALAAWIAIGEPDPVSLLFLSDAPVLPRFGDLAPGAVGTIAVGPATPAPSVGETPNMFGEEAYGVARADASGAVSAPFAAGATGAPAGTSSGLMTGLLVLGGIAAGVALFAALAPRVPNAQSPADVVVVQRTSGARRRRR